MIDLVNRVEGHGVALAILVDGLDRPRLRIQCECGWYDSCGEVIDFHAVARSVNDHLEQLGWSDWARAEHARGAYGDGR